MEDCKDNNINCNNLKLRTANKGKFVGKIFFGCKYYPDCSYLIPLHFDKHNMTDKQKKLERAFELFVQSNSFIYATYGVVYFNLRQADFLDYLLRTDIVRQENNVEIGMTGAKIYYELFYHLYLIPTIEIKRYLINNFPKTYSSFLTSNYKPRIFGDIDYDNDKVNEKAFKQYSDIETYFS